MDEIYRDDGFLLRSHYGLSFARMLAFQESLKPITLKMASLVLAYLLMKIWLKPSWKRIRQSANTTTFKALRLKKNFLA